MGQGTYSCPRPSSTNIQACPPRAEKLQLVFGRMKTQNVRCAIDADRLFFPKDDHPAHPLYRVGLLVNINENMGNLGF